MGVETMFLLSAGMQAVSGLAGYMEDRKADRADKRAYQESIRIAQEQSALDKKDAERAAEEERLQAEKFKSRQKMMFLKSGVDLVGSPLLVMEETRRKGAENAKNIMDSQRARGNLAVQEAVSRKPVARASLLSTVTGIGASAAGSYKDYSVLKRQLG